VVTSTKRDVLDATVQIRSRVGQVWLFDPSGDEAVPPGAKIAHWSPIQAAEKWDEARNMTSAMIAASILENSTSDAAHHFIDRATDTLAPMLFAAYHGRFDMGHVTDWLYQTDATPALECLNELATRGDANSRGARLAFTSLSSVMNLEARERSSVWSTATRIVSAYMTEGVRAASTNPNFDPDAFVMSADALYIASPDNVQRLCAPIIVGLLAAIKTATYDRQRRISTGEIPAQHPVVMVLDECANIAPIAELPTWLSTAGGNGLHMVVVFQDLSQVAGRWGRSVADGILTLCPTKIVMGGIADPTTLHALSEFIGDYDRQMVSTSTQKIHWSQFGKTTPTTTTTVSTQRARYLEPSDIAQLPKHTALLIDRASWKYLNVGFWDDANSLWLTIAHRSAISSPAPERVLTQG
jgi:type IV secretory pathway TraG/TraD family ATPase VirD4